MISYHPSKQKPVDKWTAGFVVWNKKRRLSEIISQYVWSPILWKDGYRRKANFICARFMVLDFDDGFISLETAVQQFKECIHIIGTTKSHQKEKSGKPACDRFRVVLMWEKPITTCSTYEYNMSRAAHINGADLQACNGAMRFKPCVDIVSVSNHGKVFAVKIPPKVRQRNNSQRYQIRGLSNKTECFLKYGVDDKRNCTAFQAALDMVRHDWTEEQIRQAIQSKTDLDPIEINTIFKSALNKKDGW